MCMQFTMTKGHKAALLALSPVWLPVALVGGFFYGLIAGTGRLARHARMVRADRERLERLRKAQHEGKLDTAGAGGHADADGHGDGGHAADDTSHVERLQLEALLDDKDSDSVKRAMLHYFLGEYTSAIAEFQRASALRSPAVEGPPVEYLLWHSLSLLNAGRVEEGFELMKCLVEYHDANDDVGAVLLMDLQLACWMKTFRPEFEAADWEIMTALVFGALYKGILSLDVQQEQLGLEMLKVTRRILAISTRTNQFKLALLLYAEGARIRGARTVQAVTADPLRLDCLKRCFDVCEGVSEDEASASDVSTLRSMAQVFLMHPEVAPDPKHPLFESASTPHYHMHSRGHAIVQHWNKSPHWCDHCGQFIKSIRHGQRCTTCRANFHAQCVPRARRAECIVQRVVTEVQHRRDANFRKRRMLLLVWKRVAPSMSKNVLHLLDGMILSP